MKVVRDTEIAAPPERVYEVVMDPRRLGDWVSIHHDLIDAPDGELEQGAELTQCLKLAGRKLNVRWRVKEDDCPRKVVWEGKGPMRSRARAVYRFEPNADSTRFHYLNEYELPGGALGRVAGRSLGRIAGREADRSLARLKELLENG